MIIDKIHKNFIFIYKVGFKLYFYVLTFFFFLLDSYFENLTSKLYVFNTHVKFHINWISFTIQFVYSSFMYNFKLQKIEFKNLIDDITIYL